MNQYSEKGYGLESALELDSSQRESLIELVKRPQERQAGDLSGRAKVTFGEVRGLGRVVVKGYHRGGLLRAFLPSMFVKWGLTRAETESEMLLYIAERGLTVPKPLATVSKGWFLYRAWLVLEEVEGHLTLAEVSRQNPDLLDELVPELARMVRELIQLRICHVDLHPGNVLVDDQKRVWMIDFDKAFFFKGNLETLQEQYLRRWRRAVIKHSLPDALSELFCGGVLRNLRILREREEE
ncbi:MAG: phosphotransferase [Bdellovibrionales bacterium]|nr:phosphotransferase [Bdellovibrionales bacterium]